MDAHITAALAEHFRGYRSRIDAGSERLGFKVAFNPPKVQQMLGLPHSLVAGLTRDTLQLGPEHSLSGASRPALEAEVSVRLQGDLRASDDEAAAVAVIASVAPALEVVDYNRSVEQLAAVLREGVFHRAVAFGQEQPTPPGARLAGVRAKITHNGTAIADVDAEEATGALPALLLHIARVLESFDLGLVAGDRLILGSMNVPVAVAPGDTFALELGGFERLALAFGA